MQNLTGKHIYKVEGEMYFELKVEIDYDKVLPEPFKQTKTVESIIKETVEFWHGWEEVLKEHNGDYIKAFLFYLGKHSFRELQNTAYSLDGLIDHFSKEEGWYPVDGTMGITIIDFDEPQIDERAWIINEVNC